MEYEATELRDFGHDTMTWAVRPRGQIGTMDWYPEPWTVIYVRAHTAGEAISKALLKKVKYDASYQSR